ncbi:MAG: MotA/TolQ/ExbB proton channel family protein [Candidatus Sumerlaeia bacterium]
MNISGLSEIIPQKTAELWDQAFEIWLSGGWAMIAIAITAFVMFSLGVRVHLRLSGKGFTRVSEKKWRHWINHPEARKGRIGRLLDMVTSGRNLQEIAVRFTEVRAIEVAPFERDLRIMKRCVSAAPLLGLLGTVTGMLATFSALASGSGGEKTMGMVASGISEALVTTETGLVIALPGLFYHYQMNRKLDKYKTFLAHLESVVTQKVYKKIHKTMKKAA